MYKKIKPYTMYALNIEKTSQTEGLFCLNPKSIWWMREIIYKNAREDALLHPKSVWWMREAIYKHEH